ncbi:MAG: antibiotic biosynthesis monooxygenase [Streptomyces sp.]|uniref:antibiotic biosynthesis monooxygenase n=1 Tax=Streptomyces sp. B93 TaxID=2824875 RepID=UPI0019AA025E|nr:antibiotic biosynthesis monooxygenase [Streptomyces sp. B93]MBC7268971.1 antibiotic biosynthesis monooxygenase [Streptomyces sp.]MBQ1088332.1 antibiotic biosynthesis monooxygenase [Streptomyces sp. B93]
MSATQPHHEPVTTVLTWRVRPGRERAFEEWAHGITECAQEFPGNEGVAWLRPENGHRYHVVLRFSDTHRLTTWLDSEQRAEWHARIEGIATEISSERQSTTGLETWFGLPGTTVRPPPRWKMVLTTFLGAYPFTFLIQWLITPHTQDWPLPLRAAVFPILLLPLLTYLVMPGLSRALRQWLYRSPER